MARVPGERVGAVQSIKGNVVELFGYGVYEGNVKCPALNGIPNPMIRLDSGLIVWGCECWWGDEETMKARIAGLEVVNVTPRIPQPEV